jgi:DNA-directed RNA polymerase specialized sigma24 family protein
MIANSSCLATTRTRDQRFLDLLPKISAVAEFNFRHLRAEARDEAVEEVIANAFVAFAKLVEQNRGHRAFGSTLGGYAVRQFHVGRRVGARLKSTDVMAHRERRFKVQRLEDSEEVDASWTAVVASHRTPVADQAAFRIDFQSWLRLLRPQQRGVVEALAANYSTSEVARQFGVSAARVSQMRRELHTAWEQFHTSDVSGVWSESRVGVDAH